VEFEEVFQEFLVVLGEDGFGVELDAVDWGFLLGDAHDFAFFGPSGDFEAIGQGLAFDDERVISGGLEGTGFVGEDALALVEDGRGFAVHWTIRADDSAAIDLADGSVAEAHSEDGGGGSNFADEVQRDADALGLECLYLPHRDDIIAEDLHLRTQLAEVLDEVVVEGIVVV